MTDDQPNKDTDSRPRRGVIHRRVRTADPDRKRNDDPPPPKKKGK